MNAFKLVESLRKTANGGPPPPLEESEQAMSLRNFCGKAAEFVEEMSNLLEDSWTQMSLALNQENVSEMWRGEANTLIEEIVSVLTGES